MQYPLDKHWPSRATGGHARPCQRSWNPRLPCWWRHRRSALPGSTKSYTTAFDRFRLTGARRSRWLDGGARLSRPRRAASDASLYRAKQSGRTAWSWRLRLTHPWTRARNSRSSDTASSGPIRRHHRVGGAPARGMLPPGSTTDRKWVPIRSQRWEPSIRTPPRYGSDRCALPGRVPRQPRPAATPPPRLEPGSPSLHRR